MFRFHQTMDRVGLFNYAAVVMRPQCSAGNHSKRARQTRTIRLRGGAHPFYSTTNPCYRVSTFHDRNGLNVHPALVDSALKLRSMHRKQREKDNVKCASRLSEECDKEYSILCNASPLNRRREHNM